MRDGTRPAGPDVQPEWSGTDHVDAAGYQGETVTQGSSRNDDHVLLARSPGRMIRRKRSRH